MRHHGKLLWTVSVVIAGLTITLIALLSPECTSTSTCGRARGSRQRWRPHFHFTANRNWINDPNGLLYYKGEYHMFYQYSTSSVKHENISWGHAVSADLVNWRELPPAILADSEEEVFSGSALVDKNNVANLGSLGAPPMLAFYTGYKRAEPHYQYQSLAYSVDLGRTWTKYEQNPLIDVNETEFRDPKVIPYADGWVMLVQLSQARKLQFYKSVDLLNWLIVGEFPGGDQIGAVGGVWECPDMFQLPLDGNRNNVKWIVIVNINPGNKYDAGSGVQYFIGDFNGTNFVPDDHQIRWLDHGMDYYAAVSFADVPRDRIIMIGWMNNWLYSDRVPTNGMSVARELQLQTINDEVMLVQKPVETLVSLRRGPLQHGSGIVLDGDTRWQSYVTGAALDLEATFSWEGATHFGVKVHASEDHVTIVGFEKDDTGFTLYVNRTGSERSVRVEDFNGLHQAPVHPNEGGRLYMRLLVDSSSVEVFGGEGEAVITDLVFHDPSSNSVTFFAEGGTVKLDEFQLWSMSSIIVHRKKCPFKIFCGTFPL